MDAVADVGVSGIGWPWGVATSLLLKLLLASGVLVSGVLAGAGDVGADSGVAAGEDVFSLA
jgi:hypothetical protein